MVSLVITSIALIVCGLFACASFIIARQPGARRTFDRLAPAQAWVGLVVCVLGVWTIVSAIGTMAVAQAPILWLTRLAVGALEFALGFVLGFGLFAPYALGWHRRTLAKGEALRARLAPYQTALGFAGIVLGIWCLIITLSHWIV